MAHEKQNVRFLYQKSNHNPNYRRTPSNFVFLYNVCPEFGVKSMELTVWDRRYLDFAVLISTWSKDPSTQVGAYIADNEGNPVGLGFNGFPRGMLDSKERLNDREFKYKHTLHAEDNAMSFSNRQYFDGCTIYVTHPPCSTCLSRMRQRRLFRVICFDGGQEFSTRWPVAESLSLAKELGIELIIVPKPL